MSLQNRFFLQYLHTFSGLAWGWWKYRGVGEGAAGGGIALTGFSEFSCLCPCLAVDLELKWFGGVALQFEIYNAKAGNNMIYYSSTVVLMKEKNDEKLEYL